MSNRVDSRVDSGSGGNFLILFNHMLIVRGVQHENLLIISLLACQSNFKNSHLYQNQLYWTCMPEMTRPSVSVPYYLPGESLPCQARVSFQED